MNTPNIDYDKRNGLGPKNAAFSGTVDSLVRLNEQMNEYINDHVHSFIDSDEIETLLSFDEWCKLDKPNSGLSRNEST